MTEKAKIEVSDDKQYTGEDVRILVHQKLLEQRVDFVENMVLDATKSAERSNTRIEAAVHQITEMIQSQHSNIRDSRDELRREIERDFMTKTRGIIIESKIDTINTRLVLTGAGIVILLSIVMFLTRSGVV